ncbi:MAG: 16S rRNA (guanine(527)-N(7))-methyltransferase RsmG, partial [Bacteroidota bacterium]
KRFQLLGPLYQDWNSKINVVSRKDMDGFYTHHVLHSLGIAKVITFEPDSSIIDVGTGGGFPGIPLAILFPHARFHLIDSVGKKIKVVEAVRDTLGLMNVTCEQARSESLPPGRFDFVVSRAVAETSEFLRLTRHLVRTGGKNTMKNGFLMLKGGELEDELRPFKRKVLVFDLKNHFSEEFFLTKKVVYLPA